MSHAFGIWAPYCLEEPGSEASLEIIAIFVASLIVLSFREASFPVAGIAVVGFAQ